jgi:hypothetical protein
LADLIVLPILNIYRKYYGLKMAAFLLVTFYVAMAGAAPVVEGLFGVLGLIPRERQARVVEASVNMELHDLAQYWISSPRGFSGVAVRHDRRHRHAADDEQAGTRR